jgi:hypothetical protein
VKWIVGTDDPTGRGDAFPPNTKGTGRRLLALSGLSADEYTATFFRTNTEEEPVFRGGDTVVVLGRVAWRHLRLPSRHPWFTSTVKNRTTYWLIPHPSGKNLMYNSLQVRRKTQRLMRSLSRR